MTLTDARGVPIAPGDTAIYGFGVGRSVAMAEAVVLGEEHADSGKASPYGGTLCTCKDELHPHLNPSPSVSLTPSGRVRLRVVRRSYSSGERPVVDVAPDRLVVLKQAYNNWEEAPHYRLPPSPLPTQDEEARKEIERRIESCKADLRSDTIVWGLSSFATLAEFHAYAAKRLAEYRRKLKALDER